MIVKRLFDLGLAIPGLLFLIPVFIFIGIWIKADSNGPVFFRQKRVGKYGKVFKIFKFRTMINDAEKLGAKVTVGIDPRVTKSGKFLRKYKLDELPQLVDVLLGRMSIVGPRPEVPEFMDLYPSEVRDKVLSVLPGITDLASIEMLDENEILSQHSNPLESYINKILPLKQGYYLDYVERRNLLLDIKIVLSTLKKILTK